MNKSDLTIDGLRTLGLTRQEAVIYLELLQKPATHAQLSKATGINRTTVYRQISVLEKQGLVTHRLDDTGKFLVAADPSTLEVEVVTQEARAKRQRAVLGRLLPVLEDIKKGYEADFAIHTYEGTDGFKRMLWHELKTTGECLCIGTGVLEDIVPDRRWAEKHRQLTVEAGYRIREITNPASVPTVFTNSQAFIEQCYEAKVIPRSILPINELVTIYNNTVATYHIRQSNRIGLEIVSKSYAQTMRNMFELLWQQSNNP
jgi:biotin operon repressor